MFTSESITLHENYDAKIMSRKALPSTLLHKSEVTYRDTGVSKKGISYFSINISPIFKYRS